MTTTKSKKMTPTISENLFLTAYSDFLQQTIDRSFMDVSEVRIVTQSLMPSQVLAIFERINRTYPSSLCVSYLKVAHGLVQHWNALDLADEERQAFIDLRTKQWLDEEDKLTWYRNRTIADESKHSDIDKLLILLVGIDHTIDKGGLIDFFVCKDNKIWYSLNSNYQIWLKHITEHEGIMLGEKQISALNEYLMIIINLVPLTLSQKADLLATWIATYYASDSYGEDYEGILASLFASLADLGIPYLKIFDDVKDFKAKKGQQYLKSAHQFISHRLYNQGNRKTKDLEKIEKYFEKNPTVITDVSGRIINTTDYLADIKNFILNADNASKTKLIQADLMPVLKALKIKEEKETTSSTNIPSYNCHSFEAVCKGLNSALEKYAKEYSISTISSITLRIKHFQHDFSNKDAENSDLQKDELAKSVLQGVLGGIEHYVDKLNLGIDGCDFSFLPLTVNNESSSSNSKITYRSATSNPHVVFETIIWGENDKEVYPFKWKLSEFQVERLHVQLAKTMLQKLALPENANCLLPVMLMPKQIYQAIYHASNIEEACRLMGLGLSDIQLHDMFADYLTNANFNQQQGIPAELPEVLQRLTHTYVNLLNCAVNKGLYVARRNAEQFLQSYSEAFDKIIACEGYVAKDIQERFYYGLFMTENVGHSSLNTAESVLVNGYHPALFELISAQVNFITSAISDIYQQADYQFSKTGLDDVFVQSEIESPILALKQKQGISIHAKSFGWLHYVGESLDKNVDLSVQALLQETDDEEDTQEILAVVPEESIVFNTLKDYQSVHSHARDGLRILATNVTNLSSLLSGLTKYCQQALIADKSCSHYALHVSVYTVGLSKLNAVNNLKAWQALLTDKFAKKDKVLQLKISHFMSDEQTINTDLIRTLDTQEETHLGRFDIAFNFSFLQAKTYGKTDSAPAITLDGNSAIDSNLIFPIIYYPKPIIQQQDNLRELRLSQRQIAIQSKHANLTANLEVSNRNDVEQYFVVSKMEYEQENIIIIETLHKLSQWVVNIDEYFDYNLLKKGDNEQHKVISFSSGYGHYGELNVTLSSANEASEKLKENVHNHLSGIMYYLHKQTLPQLIEEILGLNEALSGVANIKAILGDNEAVRNLYGYALSIKTIDTPADSLLSQWIPLDSCQHWFKEQNGDDRADLLQLSLSLNKQNKPILTAHVVEAKVGSSDLQTKAEQQIEASILHLSKLFAPKSNPLNNPANRNNRIGYNRRYWWGQLHRALILRSHINQAQAEQLNIALERLSEGDFEIHWTSSVVICHTEDKRTDCQITEKLYTDEHNQLNSKAKKYHIYQYTEGGFERTLLDKIDWNQVSEERLARKSKSTESNSDLGFINNQTGQQAELDLGNQGFDVDDFDNVVATSRLNDENAIIEKPNEPVIESTIERITEPTIKSVSELISESNGEYKDNTDVDTTTDKIEFNRKVMIGTVGEKQSPVYWEYHHKKLSNRHLLIFGASGSGKTYAIQCLLSELALSGVSSFIIDYTDGFLKRQSELVYQQVCNPEEYFVIQQPLPINPFKGYTTEITPEFVYTEKPFQVATRVKNILNSVYNDFGSQQVAIIDKVLESGLRENPNYDLNGFIEDLENEGTRGESIANKIRTLVKMNCFNTTSDRNLYEEEMCKKHAVQIIQLTQIPKDLQRIITEFILWDLWAYVQKHGHKSKPITIVLDEMQNLDHGADSPVDKLLREGRKFGISLILATQTVSNFNAEQKDRLFQASTKLFFKPATTEVNSFADLLSKVDNNLTKSDWIEHLNSLEKGQCFFVGSIDDGKGQFREVVRKLDIMALGSRGFNYGKDKKS